MLPFRVSPYYRYHTDPHYASDDHRAAARYLAERWRPGDAILVNAGYAYTALVTYWDGEPIAWRGRLVGEQRRALVQDGPWRGRGVSDGHRGWRSIAGLGRSGVRFYAMSRGETEEALAQLFAEFDRVWVYRIYDTVTDPDGAVRDWLDEHGVQFEERTFSGEGQLRVQGYSDRARSAGRMPRQYTGAALADGSLVLEASQFLAVDGRDWWYSRPGAGVACRSRRRMAKSFSLPVSLTSPGERWAQADERVMGSLYPVADWPAGSLVRTPLRLPVPPGTPPGRYQLEVGWYRFVDGQPEWLPWPSGERLTLGEVEVVAPEVGGAAVAGRCLPGGRQCR